ncbi:MAG: hypothetical protein J6J07_09405 [Oscillospiraceae bacterium]|nr:hypothetical protein [Oscillospiraceae bacterium]MBQ5323639.1 hypothetical protein [Oscillospiraceae bacterium]
MKILFGKAITVILAAVMLLAFTACKEEEIKPFASVYAKDCFDSAGYIEFIAGAEEDSDITFTANNSKNAEWSIYVFDEAFADGFRYISQAADPVLTGNGTVSVKAGQFVYIYCSVNGFTSDSPDEDARLDITFD